MSLKKCPNCNKYTLRESCSNCGTKVNETSYKFIKVKDAPKVTNPEQVQKKHTKKPS